MTQPLEVDAVAFDVGNTLCTSPLPSALERAAPKLCEALARHGARVGSEALIKAWTEADLAVSFPFATHFLQEEPIVQEALRRVGVAAPLRAFAAPELLLMCRQEIRRVLAELDKSDLLAALTKLRQGGKRLAVLSNDRAFATPTLLDWLGLADRFSVVIASEELGHEKPAPQVFQALVTRLGVAPKHIAYVGDDPIRDVDAGRGAGLKVILWQPKGRNLGNTTWYAASGGTLKPDAVLTAWSDLPGLVGVA